MGSLSSVTPLYLPLLSSSVMFLLLVLVASAQAFDLALEAELAAVEASVFSPQLRAGGDAMAKPTICMNKTVGITYSVTGNCIAEVKTNNREVLIFRTAFAGIGDCQVDFSVDNPGYMLIKKGKNNDNWRDTDSLSFSGDAQVETDIDLDAGEKMLVESASGTIKFQTTADDTRQGVAFVLILVPMSKPCHQYITAPPGTVGRITYPRFDKDREYPANTFCEWRIEAPAGHQVKIKFNDFEVGTAVEDCEGEDFIAVDASGDGIYATEERHCGDEKPGTIMSAANSINVLGYGPKGQQGGFCFNYIVV